MDILPDIEDLDQTQSYSSAHFRNPMRNQAQENAQDDDQDTDNDAEDISSSPKTKKRKLTYDFYKEYNYLISAE
jgi:hypothetical protein